MMHTVLVIVWDVFLITILVLLGRRYGWWERLFTWVKRERQQRPQRAPRVKAARPRRTYTYRRPYGDPGIAYLLAFLTVLAVIIFNSPW